MKIHTIWQFKNELLNKENIDLDFLKIEERSQLLNAIFTLYYFKLLIMKPYQTNLINAITLIVLSSWGYFSSETPSMTSLIPTCIGALLLIFTPGVKKENKVIAHIAVLLTLVIFIGLIKPLLGGLERNDTGAIARVCVMMLTTVFAMITFIRSFIAVRKERQSQQ